MAKKHSESKTYSRRYGVKISFDSKAFVGRKGARSKNNSSFMNIQSCFSLFSRHRKVSVIITR